MRLVRYNPMNELAFWGNSFNDSFFNTKPKTEESWYPAVDILNEKDNVVLNIELPGVKKEDISVNIEDRVLTIKGERKFENEEKKDSYFKKERSYGSFKRSFSLSDDVLTDNVDADFKDGVLKLTLKKDNTKEEIKQITIN
ncbi:MAG: Hsp20/alpha crystallin family protein [Desulfobacterales bacterium]|nr:Hsp20/alpha crystallin family protein [Desulfobacterales bacterium]